MSLSRVTNNDVLFLLITIIPKTSRWHSPHVRVPKTDPAEYAERVGFQFFRHSTLVQQWTFALAENLLACANNRTTRGIKTKLTSLHWPDGVRTRCEIEAVPCTIHSQVWKGALCWNIRILQKRLLLVATPQKPTAHPLCPSLTLLANQVECTLVPACERVHPASSTLNRDSDDTDRS